MSWVLLVLLAAVAVMVAVKGFKGKQHKVDQVYQSAKSPIGFKEERPIKVEQLYLYPLRGVRSPYPVPEIWLAEFGAKFDRELMLVCPKSGKRITSTNQHKCMRLEQKIDIKTGVVTVSCVDRSMKLDDIQISLS